LLAEGTWRRQPTALHGSINQQNTQEIWREVEIRWEPLENHLPIGETRDPVS
jgi:hypothetical protein